MDGAGSYSVAHRAGVLPTELTGMWGWILLRSPHLRRGSPPAPAPTKQRPDPGTRWVRGRSAVRGIAKGRSNPLPLHPSLSAAGFELFHLLLCMGVAADTVLPTRLCLVCGGGSGGVPKE